MEGIRIEFFVRKKSFAWRRWQAVPRVGDEVMLDGGGGKKPYRVKRVVWGVEPPEGSPDDFPGRQDVNIELGLIR